MCSLWYTCRDDPLALFCCNATLVKFDDRGLVPFELISLHICWLRLGRGQRRVRLLEKLVRSYFTQTLIG